MDQVSARLHVMLEALNKKYDDLVQILNITENQETIFKSMNSEPRSTNMTGFNYDEIRKLVAEMNAEKQTLIQGVLNADEVFQSIFTALDMGSEEFEQNAGQYKDIVHQIQDRIRLVMDLDIKIRVAEKRNQGYSPVIKHDGSAGSVSTEKTNSSNHLMKPGVNPIGTPVVNAPRTSAKNALAEYAKNNRLNKKK